MCLQSIMKYILFAFNFVLWGAGVAVLGIGIYLLVGGNVEDVVEVGDLNFYYSGCYVLIAAGSFAFIIGFFGCCGAMKESTCLLGLYFTCLLAIFILEVGVGIWALVNFDTIDDAVDASLMSTKLPSDPEPENSFLVMEEYLNCCGGTGGCGDWKTNKQSEPWGCACDNGDTNCVKWKGSNCSNYYGTTVPAGYTYVYNVDCADAMKDFIHNNMTIIAGIGLGIGLAEVFGMIFSMCLCNAVKKKNNGFA